MRVHVGFLIASLVVSVAPAADAKPKRCSTKGKKPAVSINAKTPIRRGPGLNYAVASFLERATCAPFSEVSMDKSWVLVDVAGELGWVPTSRLAADSRERISGVAVPTAPVGSAQSRAYADVTKQSVLLDRPDPRASARRVLPRGLKVLPLAKTEDGLWVQIRDERGDLGWIPTGDLSASGLAELPNAQIDPSMVASTSTASSVPTGGALVSSPPPPVTPSALTIDASVFAAALLPIHSLDSNGQEAIRRYDVSSFSPGTGVDITVSELGPMSVRASYVIAFLVGVTPEALPNYAIGGMQQDVNVRLGVPLEASGVSITPEVGYALGMFDIDALLPGQSGVTFVSSQTHAGTAGLRLRYFATRDLLLDGDANALVGVTSEGPATLGDAGLTFGGLATVGAHYFVTDTVAVMARYGLSYRRTSYSGMGTLDASIGEATLTDLTHGALVGMSFRFVTN